jgi:hypothetical protein
MPPTTPCIKIPAMSHPSRERLAALARTLLDAMTRSRTVTLLKDRDVVRAAIAQALGEELRREEEREENVRRRLAAVKPAPKQGSAEWELLFRKFMEEEYVRDGES